MRFILCLLLVSGLCAAEYLVENEVTINLVDGRTLTGVYDATSGQLLMRMSGGKTASVAIEARDIVTRSATSAAEARQEEMRVAARDAQRQQDADALAARQRERDERAAAIKADEDRRAAEREQRRLARETSERYAKRGMVFNPLTMTADDMDREATRIDAEQQAAAIAASRERIRQQRIAEEAAAQGKRRIASEQRRAADEEQAIQRRMQMEREEADQQAIQEQADHQQLAQERWAAVTAPLKAIGVFGAAIVVFGVTILPTIVAVFRRHPHRVPIGIVNICTLLLVVILGILEMSMVLRYLSVAVYVGCWIGSMAWAAWPMHPNHPANPSESTIAEPDASGPIATKIGTVTRSAGRTLGRAAAVKRAKAAQAPPTTPTKSLDQLLAEQDEAPR